MQNVQSPVLLEGSSSLESAQSFLILSPNRSKFGFKTAGIILFVASILFSFQNDNLSFRKHVLSVFVCLFLLSAILSLVLVLGYELVVHLGKELNSYGRWVCKEVMLLIENNHFCP